MNVLSLMPLFPAEADRAAQVKALIEQGQGLTSGVFVGFLFADEKLNLTSQEAADRRTSAGGEDFSLAQGLAIQTDRYILLIHKLILQNHALCVLHVLYVHFRRAETVLREGAEVAAFSATQGGRRLRFKPGVHRVGNRSFDCADYRSGYSI